MKKVINCLNDHNPVINTKCQHVSIEEGETIAAELFNILNALFRSSNKSSSAFNEKTLSNKERLVTFKVLFWSSNKSNPVFNEKRLSSKERLDQLKLDQDEFLFHAGTQIQNKKIYSIGGRVLNFVRLSENFSDAREKVIMQIKNQVLN